MPGVLALTAAQPGLPAVRPDAGRAAHGHSAILPTHRVPACKTPEDGEFRRAALRDTDRTFGLDIDAP
jgi:hypothetical protein